MDPLSVGSGSDFLVPIFAESLASALHRPMLLTNAAGINGTIAPRAIAHATAGSCIVALVGMECVANPLL
jgi:tripartite-type tricarboxylate transporter receptor subunit TctC